MNRLICLYLSNNDQRFKNQNGKQIQILTVLIAINMKNKKSEYKAKAEKLQINIDKG